MVFSRILHIEVVYPQLSQLAPDMTDVSHSCGMTPLTGVLYRMFNLKVMYLGFIGIFELGCLVAGTARSSNALIVGRAISGIGSGGLITGTTTIIAATVPLNKRAFVMGLGMACLALGQTVGPILGGVLTSVSWRWCFYM